MPKRSAQEQLERYQRKIRKLEEKENQRLLEALQTQRDVEDVAQNETSSDSQRDINEGPISPQPQALPDDPITMNVPLPMPEPQSRPSTPEPSSVPELNPDLLSALGESTDNIPMFGPNIHPNLAERWLPLLRKGLPKETKEKLMKEYLIPENCPLLLAPKLNPEISAAVTDVVRHRDKKLENFQQQIGIGLSAINKSLTLLLTGEEKLTAIKHLSDGCRLLSDLHFLQSQARIRLITPGLAKSFLNVIQDGERDDTLFGNKLPEKIKASKAIEKQGLQIKKPAAKTPTAASTSLTTSRTSQYQENWQNTSRFPSNRGGRGGQRKPPPSTSGTTRKWFPQVHSRPAGQSKPRAAPHH